MYPNDGIERLESKANPRFQMLKRLAQDNQGARLQQRVWLEGDHLIRAALQRGYCPSSCIATEAGYQALQSFGFPEPSETIVLSVGLWRELSQLGSACQFACVVDLPTYGAIDPLAPSVILDRIQDPGNVGSILRSASAFGYRQVLALVGTAALWSPKVMRAGMGAHFGLQLHESLSSTDLLSLSQLRCVTSSHAGQAPEQILSVAGQRHVAWIFGNEGQGVAPELASTADGHVKIDQPGGEESLNVAAAAAICLHASAVYKK